MPRKSEQTTIDTIEFVDSRVYRMNEAIESEAYVAAAEFAEEAAQLLRALSDRLVRERVTAGMHGERP